MSSSLSIRPGVYFASVQCEGVVMDLVEDRYYGLVSESAAIWQALERGRTVQDIADTVFPVDAPDAVEQVVSQIHAWEEAGLVTSEPGTLDDLPHRKSSGVPAVIGLDTARVAASRLSFVALSRLVLAMRWSRRALAQRGPGSAVARAQAVRAAPSGSPTHREDALHRTMRAYYASRRLINQGKEDCLPRSLALVVALRKVGVDAEICFGVRKFPFLAHAWVEEAGRVLNDDPRYLAQFALLARF